MINSFVFFDNWKSMSEENWNTHFFICVYNGQKKKRNIFVLCLEKKKHSENKQMIANTGKKQQ
jgi:hypothetical protein